MHLTIRVLGFTFLDVEVSRDTESSVDNEPTEPWPFGFTARGDLATGEIGEPGDIDTTVRR